MTALARLTRPLATLAAVVPVLATLTVVGAATGVGPRVVGCAEAATVHHAALVVEHSDGAVIKVCVAFSGTSITGEQLLASSGVEYATKSYSGLGDAVCQIDYEPPNGQVPPNCFGSSYWAMYVSVSGGAWTQSQKGVSSQTFQDGDAEGFLFGQGSGVPPSPRGVCPVTPPTTAPVTTAPPAKPPTARATSAPTASVPHAHAAAATAGVTEPVAPSASAAAVPLPTSEVTPSARALGSPLPSPPPTAGGIGPWSAAAFAILLVAGLVYQVMRGRRSAAPQ